MRLRVGAATSAGRRRPENQDYLLYRIATPRPDAERDCSLFVAADGVGGAVGGAVASEVAAHAVEQHFPRRGVDDLPVILTMAVQAADTAVSERAATQRDLTGMGTTLVIAVVRDGAFWMANVGDSRGYLIRGGEARQVTEDHSVVAESMRAGQLTAAAAATHPYRHVITRSLGTDEPAEADTFGPYPLQPGDRLLLCTDGLTETMEPSEFAPLAALDDPEAAAAALVDAANERGGPDNISVIVVAVV